MCVCACVMLAGDELSAYANHALSMLLTADDVTAAAGIYDDDDDDDG